MRAACILNIEPSRKSCFVNYFHFLRERLESLQLRSGLSWQARKRKAKTETGSNTGSHRTSGTCTETKKRYFGTRL